MKKYDLCFMVSGLVSRTVEAETYEQAVEQAREDIYNSDWNDIGCPEVEVLDCEVIEEESL